MGHFLIHPAPQDESMSKNDLPIGARTEEGRVLEASASQLPRDALIARAAPRVAEHLERSCWWLNRKSGGRWQNGDYASYILLFERPDNLIGTIVVRPELNNGLSVFAGTFDRRSRCLVALTDAARQALEVRRFTPVKDSVTFRKPIDPATERDCHSLAKEIVGVMVDCLGYDARAPLAYRLSARKRPAAKPESQLENVVCLLTYEDLGQLLRSRGYEVGPAASGNPRFYISQVRPRFGAGLILESAPGSGRYLGFMLTCREVLSPATAAIAQRELDRRLAVATTRIVDDGGIDLVQRVLLSGGVTEANLRDQLACWDSEMKEFRQAIAEVCGQMDPRTMH